MRTISDNAKAIFLQAVEKHSPEEWQEFLDQACGDDSKLRGHVEGLLQAHTEDDSLFDRVEATQNYEPLVLPGQMLGPYKIREEIGDGGMGVVYVAEQEKPLRRKVALKVIKPGMDSRAVLARFDAERNALALMNHPHIAKVLDAGTTDQGRPYFVMELIQGKPITEYCDHKKLKIPERLELFTQICRAVQHAHQKGVIHRDIKPSNILVTEIDGKPVPKVIDFGVAKALGANLTDRTIYTNFQSLVGTPLYMSPEQTQLSGVDVDTSSDVYSLGILLYELLTGTTPLSPEELRQAAQDEVLRCIRETEPPRPSNRISSLGENSSQISERRSAEPEQLGRLVRGDLDWIVMKALEKDRNGRYKTADAFAADIGRHLLNEPVEACPPSTAYRLSRFYRRNKVAVTFVTLLLTLLAVAVPVISIGWRWAWIERLKAEQYASDLRQEFLGQAITEVLSGDFRRTEPAIQKARNLGVDDDTLVMLKALEFFYGGEPESARKAVRPLLKKNENHVGALCVMIMSHMDADDPTEFFRYHALLPDSSHLPSNDIIANLLLSQVLLNRNPQRSFDITQELIDRYPYWPTLRALHGSAMIIRAVDMPEDERRIEQVADGIESLKAANQMVPDNQFVMTEYLVGLTYAIELGDSLQDQRTNAWQLAIEELIDESSERNWQNRRFESFRGYYLASIGGGDVESLEWHWVAIKLLLFGGDTEAAKDYARVALANEPIYADRWALRAMEYMANPTAENEERLAALAGPFSVPQAYVETGFGMQAFAEGNRPKALSHFKNAVATGKMDWFSYCIADAMLRRMNASRVWPSWIKWQHDLGRTQPN